MKFFVTICFLSGATNQQMIQLCRIGIKTDFTDLLIENWYTWTVKDTLWTICYPAISQIFILYPPHIYSMTMSELLSVSSHATMIMNDCKCHGLAVKVFWSYVQDSGFNPRVPEVIQGRGGKWRERGIQGAGGESQAARANRAKKAFCHVLL